MNNRRAWATSTPARTTSSFLPRHPVRPAHRGGVGGSRTEALTYLEATVGDTGRSTSRERKEAFVDGIEDFVVTAEKHGLVFARSTDYPDYYPELPGGKIGRAIEVKPLNSKVIGKWWKTISAPAGMPIKTDDVWLLGRAWSTPAGFLRGAQFVFRALGGVVRGQRLVGIGAGLSTAFRHAVVLKHEVPLWLNAPLEELLTTDGRVTGVRITRDGQPLTVRATRGVMLAGGGFDHNTEWRRSLPYSIIVDAHGDRFANESESYVDLGHHMLEHDKDGAYWMIADVRHARRYLRTFALDPKNNKAMREAGIMAKGSTLAELAARIGIDPARLQATADRFNGFARSGVDGDFGRGNSAYDRYYGDPTVHPNPCLGPLEKGPFTAFKVVIGDLGTKGGVLTDAEGRALREDGTVIDGLYAAGNNSASVMGRTYPGPGSTIGPAVVFGMRAARHMARWPSASTS
ncbi:FAD-binding protein [Micromonospora zamorensis]|uniref:FAD-binding protein n=1 Tax=Micromonospora zamorensis TaxID=709883 RepID=UPI0036AB7378